MLHLDKNGELQPRLIEEWVTHMRQVLRGQHHIYLLDWIDSFAQNYITLRFEQQWPQLVDTGDDWTKWSHEAIFSHMLKVWNKQKGAKTDISLESYYRDITPRAGHGEHGFISLEAWNAWTAKALSRYEEEVRGLGADLSTSEHKACIDTLLTHLPMTNDQTKYLHMKILEKGKPKTIPQFCQKLMTYAGKQRGALDVAIASGAISMTGGRGFHGKEHPKYARGPKPYFKTQRGAANTHKGGNGAGKSEAPPRD